MFEHTKFLTFMSYFVTTILLYYKSCNLKKLFTTIEFDPPLSGYISYASLMLRRNRASPWQGTN